MGMIVRRPLAEDDLIEIWSYIADDNEPAADRLLRKIEQSLRNLSDSPLIGRARPELSPGLRSFPVGTYIIFYLPLADGVEVVRVLSGYLDIQSEDMQLGA